MHCLNCGPHSHITAVTLGHGTHTDQLGAHATHVLRLLLIQSAGLIKELTCRLRSHSHLRQLETYALMSDDWLAETLSLLGIGSGILKGSGSNAKGLSCHPWSGKIEGLHHHVEAFTFLAEEVFSWYFTVLEYQLHCIGPANTKLIFLLAYRESRCTFFNYEYTSALVGFSLRVRDRIDRYDIRHPTIGNEVLCTVEDVRLTVLYRTTLKTGNIRARSWFG